MAGIRMHMKKSIHFVTNRCEQEQFLMLPSERISVGGNAYQINNFRVNNLREKNTLVPLAG
ncbi:MAG: hypothetical protein GY847_19305 [Proteobacteria bacterium]|nr:hypothetical protein [Pseudomonadota bacterium]